MLVAIDASVDHRDALAAGALNGAKLLMLDPHQDAIRQVTQAVHRFAHKLQSLHIVTHGSSGSLHFSSGDLNLHNLPTYAAEIESWFRYRPLYPDSAVRVQSSTESFLSLYACSLASGEAGEAFLKKLQFLVGVSVHASKGKVGSTVLNGSWQLEIAYPFEHRARFPFTDDLLETYEAVL
ncbi:MAG: protein of unknown function (DUF4347) [Phormidesmis priestleyi Ana]|uniref:DUF4347 domain-containing protein n=1 Tax=Phormidesmis priestleyi Ana TaxID=1666911 RepID=A0A0P7YVK8_9CYAN|nr:MAG: protein of unknown function (DUF4347) [Phormidesmis priestleyi Ana]